MKIATWNVNSIRVRKERLLAWLEKQAPDVLCLQELKGVEDNFPWEEVRSLGYDGAVHAQKTYNGVAILSRHPVTQVERGLSEDADQGQARFIVAKVEHVWVACIYLPNGGNPESEKYTYKLNWLRHLEEWAKKALEDNALVALCGDFNIAPADLDVCDPTIWNDTVLCTPAVRDSFSRILALGYEDTFRKLHPGKQSFSWWDYRQLAFPKNQGLRIDHILASSELAQKLNQASVDREERKGKSPSDHAPVIAEFDF